MEMGRAFGHGADDAGCWQAREERGRGGGRDRGEEPAAGLRVEHQGGAGAGLVARDPAKAGGAVLRGEA